MGGHAASAPARESSRRAPVAQRETPINGNHANRRSYGTGSLIVRADSAGRETWYGKWYANGRRVKRVIGRKRAEGSRDGLTRAQAEAELRRLMVEVQVVAPVGHSLTVAAAGERYRRHLKRAGRKRSTIVAVESALRVHLVSFFTDKALDAIRHEDVVDLVAVLEGKGLSPKSIHNYVGTLSALFNHAKAPQRRWAAVNPCDGVELPGVPEHDEIRFLDEAEWEAVLRHVQAGEYHALDRAFYHGDHGRAPPRRADRVALARRGLAGRTYPRATELGPRRVRHAEVAQGQPQRPNGRPPSRRTGPAPQGARGAR